MPFRRKCEDEVPHKVQIPYHRGPLGPVRVYLMGFAPDRPVPFSPDDPDGEKWLMRSRSRGERALEGRKVLPQEERISPDKLVDRDEWWESAIDIAAR